MHRGFKVVFWGIETTLAVVAGISEALIYEAYAPSDWAGVGAAFLRAGAMQLGIIIFGLAAVRAAQQGKRNAQFMANAFSLGFSAISAWFVRESALAEKHLDFLQPAYHQPLVIPFWGSIGGQSIDPTLVGAIPFLIWAVNVFAPIILNDGKLIYTETEAEMQARFKREEMERQHQARLRQIAGKGWRDTIAGAVTGVSGREEATPPPAPQGEPAPIIEVASEVPPAPVEEETPPSPSRPDPVPESAPKPGTKAFKAAVRRQVDLIRAAGQKPTIANVARLMNETEANVAPAFDEFMAARSRR
jgi:hypothetical protein